MRIGIDCRRGIGSGVGRTTHNLTEALLQMNSANEFVLFTGSNNLLTELPDWNDVVITQCEMNYHSSQDYFEFPRVVSDQNLDLFIAPQYYVSPNVMSPTIKFVHDLWPLLHPEWVPTSAEFSTRFGSASLRDSMSFLRDFTSSQRGRLTIAGNKYLNNYFRENRNNQIALYYATMFLLAFEKSDVIICPSAHSQNEVRAIFPEYFGKVVVIRHCVNPVFRPGSKEKKNFVLHVSNWEPRKNIETLVEAFENVLRSDLKDLRLVLVGNMGESNYSKHVRDLINASPYSHSISSFGVVSDGQLLGLYQSAKAYVCPSFYEGFGIPLIEAMASGTPVISSKAAALPEVCGTAALYFDPRESLSLSGQLKRLLSDDCLYNDLISKGFNRTLEYDIMDMSVRLLSVIKHFG